MDKKLLEQVQNKPEPHLEQGCGLDRSRDRVMSPSPSPAVDHRVLVRDRVRLYFFPSVTHGLTTLRSLFIRNSNWLKNFILVP